jgi:hypothetical protein
MDNMGTKEVFADREHHYAGAPAWTIFRALTDNRHRWLWLHPGEVLPTVLEAVPNQRVAWSSFWPLRPDDTIELTLTEDRGSITLRFVWLTNAPPR